MMQSFTKIFKDLAERQSGTALVELALYLPLLLVMFGGMVDFTEATTQKLRAQQAVARTLEMVNNSSVANLTVKSLQAEAARAASLPEDRVVARIWLECDGVVQAGSVTTCASSTSLARFASITIRNSYELRLFSALSDAVGKNKPLEFEVQGSLRIQ